MSSDAYQWTYERHIKDDPEVQDFMKEVKVKADLAGQIYDIRNRLHMTRADLAEFSGLSPQVIEDLEESDYDGSWEEAVHHINRAFHNWFENVILQAAKMKRDDYSVKILSA